MRVAKLRKRVARLHELQRAYQAEHVRPEHSLCSSVKGLLKKLKIPSGSSQRDVHFALQTAKAELIASADKSLRAQRLQSWRNHFLADVKFASKWLKKQEPSGWCFGCFQRLCRSQPPRMCFGFIQFLGTVLEPT